MTLKIAAICTRYHPLSHADVIVTRWLEPHMHDAVVGFRPRSKIASLYVAQISGEDPSGTFHVSPNGRPERFDPGFDISRLASRQYGVPMFDTIREALTLGGDALAVDAVLLIGEHGDYPLNAYGQILYPRKEMWDEVIAVFRDSGRVAPVFFDKHLSWNMDWARDIVRTAREMGIPFFAGSSIPITGPAHPLNLGHAPDLEASLGLFYVGAETYGIHSMEFVQSLIERRRGGESGVAAITAYEGEGVWRAMDDGAWSRELFEGALAACPAKADGDYRQNCRRSGITPVACVFEHLDGHRQAHVMLHGHISEFCAALERRMEPPNEDEVWASYCDTGPEDAFAVNFAHLCREIERFFQTGQSPVPIERNLLTTLQVATFMHALQRPGQRIETPHLHIAYQPASRPMS